MYCIPAPADCRPRDAGTHTSPCPGSADAETADGSHCFVSGYTRGVRLAEGARLHHSSGRVAGRAAGGLRHRPAVRRTVRISLSAGPDGHHHAAVSRRQQLLFGGGTAGQQQHQCAQHSAFHHTFHHSLMI